MFGCHLRFVYRHDRRLIYFGLAVLAVALTCCSIVVRLGLPGYRSTPTTNLCAFAAWGCAFLQYREQVAASRDSRYATTIPSFSFLPLLWMVFWLGEILVTFDMMRAAR